MENRLFYGDNLDILRNYEYFPSECIDLIYLDPPFNSNRSYNVLFKDESGLESEAQITAFEDTWHWLPPAISTYYDLLTDAPERVSTAIEALYKLIGGNQMMAYLVMMTARLVELHRVLKPTGSLYLHCDPTASHYLKIILDAIFEPANFRNEIVWKRTQAHNDPKRCGSVHDIILSFVKDSRQAVWYGGGHKVSEEYLNSHYSKIDEQGRRYQLIVCHAPGPGPARTFFGKVMQPPPGRHWTWTQENIDKLMAEGRIVQTKSGMPRLKQFAPETVPLQDIWADIDPINSQAAERLGYPTQKPLTLLERIIEASSKPGDVVLDPFCGCGTAIAAAQNLGRQWIGIDITHLSVALQKYRLADMFGLIAGKDYEVIGEPASVDGARELAREDPFQFQFWALSLIQARPLGGKQGSRQGKRGADRGIDGVINFIEQTDGTTRRVIVQVKSGKVKSGDVRDLVGTVTREEAAIGVFISLEPPTDAMRREAASAGYYYSPGWGRNFQKIQLLTVQDLLNGGGVEMPPAYGTFRHAERMELEAETRNLELFPTDDRRA